MNSAETHPVDRPAPAVCLSNQTRERLLDAAESLFAQHGLDAVSTRDITGAAGANVCAVNYYFGGKQGLVLAIFERRLTPLDAKRIAALEAAERAAGEGAPSLEAVVEALVRPMLEEAFDSRSGHANFARLIGRVAADPSETVGKLRERHFGPLFRRFRDALHRAIPGLTDDDLYWRMIFTFGSLHFMVLARHIPMPDLPARKPDRDAQIKRLVSYASAGLRGGAGC